MDRVGLSVAARNDEAEAAMRRYEDCRATCEGAVALKLEHSNRTGRNTPFAAHCCSGKSAVLQQPQSACPAAGCGDN